MSIPRSVPWAFAFFLSVLQPSASAANPFLRADANGDAKVDISDAVHTLGFLFGDGLAPRCADAADANDDGRIDISDAVYTLNFLFLGSAAPPAPGPSLPGADPTQDALDCGEAAIECVPSGVTEAEATRTSASGSVTVQAVLLNALEHCPKPEVKIQLALDTHSVDLSAIDIAAASRLETSSGGSVTTGLAWSPASESSHHRSGTLTAPAPPLAGEAWLRLTVEGVAGSDRLFTWGEELVAHDAP